MLKSNERWSVRQATGRHPQSPSEHSILHPDSGSKVSASIQGESGVISMSTWTTSERENIPRVLNWQGNVVPSSWLNIVLLSINLRKIVQFTQNYFDVQMGPNGKDVF